MQETTNFKQNSTQIYICIAPGRP